VSRIAVVGTGYVGLVSGTLLSDFGHDITCVDIDQGKIDQLNHGFVPIFEPDLKKYIEKNQSAGRLHFTTDVKYAVETSDIIFIAVGTPPQEDGSADLKYVLSAAESVAAFMNGYKVIVDKSTVPVGTSRRVASVMQTVLDKRGAGYAFDIVSNPEFLREGSAVYDFLHPDRVVIGTNSEKAKETMKDVYKVLYLNETPFVFTNPETAELIKYASNAFLAVKIAYINEIADLCDKIGADVNQVAVAMGKDGRIGSKYLHAGPGYGGSCFPKDTRALATIAQNFGENISLVEATVKANERQKQKMVIKILDAFDGKLNGKTIAFLGITFKPNTDDMREAPALVIIPQLVKYGARIRIFDPAGTEEGKWRFHAIEDSLTFCENEYQAAEDADGIVLMTEWNQFRTLAFDRIVPALKDRYFFDFRNVYNREQMESLGLHYYAVGR
jgi:UDPglucose 6-dehydrogenase